jgi:DeoR family transcriptional regulator, suf operon transcriptional repressor
MTDATISTAGLKIIKMLVGNPPFSVSDLIEITGVTRTAVTEQLNELVTSGYVERGAERLPGRGRPRHIYKATNAALVMLCSTNRRLIAPVLWQAIGEIGGEELTLKVRKKVSRILVELYSGKVTAKRPEDRLRQLMQIFSDEGGIVDMVQENGQLIAYKRSCPFITLVDENRTICQVDLEMMTQVVGRPVRRIACRHDGDPCCKFEIVL